MKRLKIKTGNPAATDSTLQQIGPCALEQEPDGSYSQIDNCYILRILANAGFVEFAIKNQGYCEIVEELPE